MFEEQVSLVQLTTTRDGCNAKQQTLCQEYFDGHVQSQW